MIATSDSIKVIGPALLAFQGSVEGVKKDRKNDHFKSRYATLEAVIDAARPHLQTQGIVFMQSPGAIVDGALEVTTLLLHAESGEWMRGTQHMLLGKRDPQGAGSALTYAMRYALMAMLGLPPTDDDGEGAMDRDGQAFNAPARQAGAGRKSSAQLKREGVWGALEREIAECEDMTALRACRSSWLAKADEEGWPTDWRSEMQNKFVDAKATIEAQEVNAETGEFPGDFPAMENLGLPALKNGRTYEDAKGR